MKRPDILAAIDARIRSKGWLDIKRAKCEDRSIDLIPLKISDHLILGQYEYDFFLDGYKIIRLRDITEARPGEFHEELLRREGLLDSIKEPPVRVDSWQTALEDLRSIGENIIIECERLSEDELHFFIGKIEKVYKNTVHFRPFDCHGKWEDSWVIPYSQITSITFNGNYINVYSKYLDTPD